MGSVVSSTVNIFLSIILGAISVAYVAVEHAPILKVLQTGATQVATYIKSTNIPDEYNVWVGILINDNQILFLFFVILARIVLASITALGKRAMGY